MNRRALTSAFALGLVLSLALALPAAAVRPQVEKAKVSFALDRTAYEPGTTARLAAVLDIEDGWHVNANPASFDYLIPTALEVEAPAGWPQAAVTYPQGKKLAFAFAEEPLSVYDGRVVLVARLAVPPEAGARAARIRASVTYQACDDSSCLPPVTQEEEVEVRVGAAGEPANEGVFAAASSVPAPPAGGAPRRGLLGILVLALLGGLILNAMPCVLPVLSLKVFGLVKSAGEGGRAVSAGALATAAGILISFWGLAAAAIAAKSAGSAVGWGIQFQNSAFVTFLTVVVLLFCLNLWGLFEITLPARLARLEGHGRREGAIGHFASGLFATLMATPCSAPFLGTALGFALGQTAAVILAVFTAVGVGMALPYLVLAVAPDAARLLPRPGAWMDTVRGLMGFLLAGAAVWLLFVLSAQVSPVRLAVIEVCLVVIALFVWLRHRAATGPRTTARLLVTGGLLASLVATLALAWKVEAPAAASRPAAETPGLISWAPFDRGEAEALAAEGRLVFVDVTADWCFTCKFNEKLVLDTAEVAGAFARQDVLAMKADWTNRNDEIGDYLASFGRYGIPFYVLYRPGAPPKVFSELLSKDAVLAALEEAETKVVERR